MYTDSYDFYIQPGEDLAPHLEELDRTIESHSGTLKHVTHAVVAVNDVMYHYYTLFFEGEEKEGKSPDYV